MREESLADVVSWISYKLSSINWASKGYFTAVYGAAMKLKGKILLKVTWKLQLQI